MLPFFLFCREKGGTLIVPLFFFLFLISFTSAGVDTNLVDDVFQINTVIDYSKPCINNGTYCSAAAVCNFTVLNPDNDVRIDNQQGDNQVSVHNISITFNEAGIWTINQVCHDGGLQGAETYYAQVTGSGFNDTLGFYILILAIGFGLIIFGFYLSDGWVTILGTFALYFVGIYILFNGIVGMKDLTTTWAIGIIILAIAFYISIRSALEILNK